MHDIDRAMFELESETGEIGHETYEIHEANQYEAFEASHEAEALEMEMATRLLEVNSEEELEEFLGSLVRSAASAARSFAGSATGRALGGVLKNAARQVLPQVGGIVGSALGGDVGGQFGTRAGRWLGSQFELEALSQEDRELEVARAFVRTARDAARIAVRTGGLPPHQAATAAVVTAARRNLPGLVPVITSLPPTGSRRGGRWVRQGRRIVVYGA
ncbi:hypothetical protein [Nocardioides sp.]|uniref:hypothetical protein n=1 Tax=Nocardioides sp. TaxID=35761 RepID=UPI002D7FA099|nr:hypothetical protein [Nocardioides sp.]HET8960652.1 hypothetical protein [Nocardioides sp.]